MAHTLPDYTTKYKLATIFGQIDTGELAARLFSPISYDRRGNIVFIDTFEETTPGWKSTISGVGGTFTFVNTESYQGNYSMRLNPLNTTGSYVNGYKLIEPVPLQKIGLEFVCYMENPFTIVDFCIDVNNVNGNYETTIRYTRTGGTVKYLDSAGNYTLLTGTKSLINGFHNWCHMKLVVDFSKEEYMRALIADKTFDMTGLPIKKAAAGTSDYISIRIQSTAEADFPAALYVDNVIITQNEP
jgi:hypothetical protein